LAHSIQAKNQAQTRSNSWRTIRTSTGVVFYWWWPGLWLFTLLRHGWTVYIAVMSGKMAERLEEKYSSSL
jgi:hypothetical protein